MAEKAFTDFYIAPVPEGKIGPVFPPRRQAQLDNTINENHRRQRYFAWKLLEYGLRKSLDLVMEQMDFQLDERGRWSCPECFFSLSHSGGAVAVAISGAPVGVDLEEMTGKTHPGLAKKILTQAQLREYMALEEASQKRLLLENWCLRESLFKWREAAPMAVQPPKSCTGTVTVAGKEYSYALVSEQPHRLFLLKEDDAWN